VKADILVKTPRRLEDIAASRIEEICGLRALPKPYGFLGVVLVRCEGIDKDEAVRRILNEVPEVEKVLPIHGMAKADPNEIAKVSADIARHFISKDASFAVRTVRRGSHSFTSIDVNVRVGSEVQRVTGADVDLTTPDKVIWVEIMHDVAYISFTDGGLEWKKMWPGKSYVLPLLRKISIVQMPYLGPLNAVRTMGIRIGRAVQTFEVKELIIAPKERIPAFELKEFLKGIFEGINSRYDIQKRSYGRAVHKVPVFMQDLYQFVREKAHENIIVTSTRGVPLSQASDVLVEMFKDDHVFVLIGAREGIPTGIFRFAKLVLDVAPGITLPTDHAASSILIALISALEQAKALPVMPKRRKRD